MFKLIAVWSEDINQRMFKTSRCNKEICAKISRKMEAAGYMHSHSRSNFGETRKADKPDWLGEDIMEVL